MTKLQRQPHLLKRVSGWMVSRLLTVNPLRFAVIFLVLAVIISVMIVLAIDLLWDGKLNAELQFAGVLTPLIDATLLVTFVIAMLNVLRAEVAKRETAERILNEAQRIAKIGNWILDLTTDRLTWSEEIFRIFEIDAQSFDASYQAFAEAIHPEDRAKVDAAFQSALKAHTAYNIEHRLLMKDGRIKYVAERAEMIYGAGGEPLRSIGTVQDITDLKLLEHELQVREGVFRGLFENMSSAVAIFDAIDNGDDFIFRDFNRAGEMLENTKCGQLINKRLTKTFPKFVESGLLAVLQRVWRTGAAEHVPLTLYSSEGITGWREYFIYRLQSGEVVAIYNDVTERKLAEIALKESRESLQLLLDSMAEGAYGVDNNGKCTFINRAFLNILGYQDPAEIVGHNVHALIHHTHANGRPYLESECRMHKAYEDLQPINVSDEVYWRKDGTAIPVEYWSYPIVKDGSVIGAIATFVDITERRKAEQEIHQLAFYDALTGLANRRLFHDRLRHELVMCKRNGYYGALLFLDLDNFKPLNDAYGHEAGDMLLIELACRIRRCLREVDFTARLGGDEFVVMLSELDVDKTMAAKQAGIVAEKLRASLAEPYSLTIQREENKKHTITYHCTASIGVIVFDDKVTEDEILRYADMAMYQAKDAGGNLTRFYDING